SANGVHDLQAYENDLIERVRHEVGVVDIRGVSGVCNENGNYLQRYDFITTRSEDGNLRRWRIVNLFWASNGSTNRLKIDTDDILLRVQEAMIHDDEMPYPTLAFDRIDDNMVYRTGNGMRYMKLSSISSQCLI